MRRGFVGACGLAGLTEARGKVGGTSEKTVCGTNYNRAMQEGAGWERHGEVSWV